MIQIHSHIQTFGPTDYKFGSFIAGEANVEKFGKKFTIINQIKRSNLKFLNKRQLELFSFRDNCII